MNNVTLLGDSYSLWNLLDKALILEQYDITHFL